MHHASLACVGMAATADGGFLDLFTDVGVLSSDMDRRVFYASNVSFEETVTWRNFVWR